MPVALIFDPQKTVVLFQMKWRKILKSFIKIRSKNEIAKLDFSWTQKKTFIRHERYFYNVSFWYMITWNPEIWEKVCDFFAHHLFSELILNQRAEHLIWDRKSIYWKVKFKIQLKSFFKRCKLWEFAGIVILTYCLCSKKKYQSFVAV